MLAVADETGIRDLDRLKAATAALADPRRTDPAAAERLIEAGRPLYYLNAVLHADETGSTEAMLELAYRLAVSEQPMIRRIRQEVGGPHQPGLEPRRPRPGGGVVLPLPEGQDRLRRPAPPVAALLVELRLRGHQPRRAPAGAPGDEGGARHVPRVAPDRGPRPARGHRPAPHLERHRPLQPARGPHHPRRVPGDGLRRGAGHDRLRHARGLHLEVRRGLRPSLPRLGGHEPQQPRPGLRDLGQRHRGDGAAHHRRLGRHHGVVPPAAPAAGVHLVGARQRQLHADRGPRRPRPRGQERQGDAAQLLPEGLELVAQGRGAGALRVRDPRGPGRPPAGRADGGPPARPAHRGVAREGAACAEGGPLPRRLLRGPPRPALPELRGGPPDPAAVPEGRRRALRRHLLGAARALPTRGHSDRRCLRGRPSDVARARPPRRRRPRRSYLSPQLRDRRDRSSAPAPCSC